MSSANSEGRLTIIKAVQAGVYDPYAAISRRSVLGESLMIDPAVHCAKRPGPRSVRSYRAEGSARWPRNRLFR